MQSFPCTTQTLRHSLMPHFGCRPNKKSRDALAKLRAQFSQADAFWNGQIYVKDKNGIPTPARIELTQPEDAKQVDSWYEPRPNGGPYYKNPKWRTWWQQKIAPKSKVDANRNEKVIKLTGPGNVILGVMDLIKHFPNPFGPGTITKGQGLRINPDCIKLDPTDGSTVNAKPLYSGAGSALVTQVIVDSLLNGDRGFGGNSTLGAEGFYHKLGFSERTAEDGKRTYFFTNPAENVPFLSRQFARYQAMHDQAQQKTTKE